MQRQANSASRPMFAHEPPHWVALNAAALVANINGLVRDYQTNLYYARNSGIATPCINTTDR
jgi:hypothetical protein